LSSRDYEEVSHYHNFPQRQLRSASQPCSNGQRKFIFSRELSNIARLNITHPHMQSESPTSPKMHISDGISSTLPIVPIGIVVFFILMANAIFVVYRLCLPYPIDPWEAGIVTDAWRFLQGEAIYAVGADHATHMYGPLITVTLAQLFKLTGLALWAGRVVSAILGIGVVVALAMAFTRGDRLTFTVAIALLLAANSRTGYYFSESRPDIDSIFFTIFALIVFYQAEESTGKIPALAAIIAGSALLIIAVMFKQTALAFVFVPMLATLAQFGKISFRNKLFFAAIPIVVALVALGTIWHFSPGVWHFMMEVPAQYRVPGLRVARMSVELLVSVPLFVVALLQWLYTDALHTWQLPRIRWLTAAMICAIPSSIAAAAKEGGSENSLIPALLCIGAFLAWRAPVALELLRDNNRPLPLRITTGLLLGTLVFAHAYPVPGALSRQSLKGGHGVMDRDAVVAETSLLPGSVVSPDDPTIALMAKGYAGRTGVFELDAVHWDARSSIQAVAKEISLADYVVAMRHGLSPDGSALVTTTFGSVTSDEVLESNGFTKSKFRTTSTPVYQLWRRIRPPAPSSAPLR
jgi:hypothetical protein